MFYYDSVLGHVQKTLQNTQEKPFFVLRLEVLERARLSFMQG